MAIIDDRSSTIVIKVIVSLSTTVENKLEDSEIEEKKTDINERSSSTNGVSSSSSLWSLKSNNESTPVAAGFHIISNNAIK